MTRSSTDSSSCSLQACLSARGLFGLISLACLGLILFALYLQHYQGEHPCPLCITQRVFVMGIGLLALAAFLQNAGRRGRRVWSALIASGALGGGAVAARHVWIQHLPEDQVPACGPGLEYMFENFPFKQALELLFMGDGNCADVGWTFLTLSIPAWTLMAFIGFLAVAVIQFFRPD